MTVDNIKKIIEAMEADPKVQELLKDTPQPENQETEIRVYADIAAQLGYDITEEDLKTYLENTSMIIAGRTEEAAGDIQELPDDVLDKVAGGKKDHESCMDTYRDYENCWYNDGCDLFFRHYHDYICHKLDYVN